MSILDNIISYAKKRFKKQWNKIYAKRLYRNLVLKKKIEAVRKKEKISVLYIIHNASLWKTDSLYKAMLEHPRFDVEILVVPNVSLRDEETRLNELEQTRRFFEKKNYHFVEWCNVYGDSKYEAIPEQYDVLIYPQPWPGLVPQTLDFPNNFGRLMINCEYAFHSQNRKWAYNKLYQNAAWLDCFENEETYRFSCKIKPNKGVNSIVTGLPIEDEFSRKSYDSPWKPQAQPCKKIIWAPHWTIEEKSSKLPSYSRFLEIADYMLSFAQSQIGRIQIAFKPHPYLKRELYKHPDWGKERTESYYAAWERGENTQLEQGEYVDLFMTSDAMIHDSCSFCCEYLMTGKAVLFMVKNEQIQVSQLNEMAKKAFYSQYLGYTLDDLQVFLNERVIQGNDINKNVRLAFVEKYLIPPNGQSAAGNIINAILGINCVE